MLTMFPLIYMTTNGGPGTPTTNLALYLYKTAMLVQRPKSDMRMIFFIRVELEVIYRVINFQREWG